MGASPSSPGPLCWSCARLSVEVPGDFCDDCFDALGDDIAGRLLQRGW